MLCGAESWYAMLCCDTLLCYYVLRDASMRCHAVLCYALLGDQCWQLWRFLVIRPLGALNQWPQERRKAGPREVVERSGGRVLKKTRRRRSDDQMMMRMMMMMMMMIRIIIE